MGIFLSWIINIWYLHDPNQTHQISVSKKENSIFGELFHLMFMVLHDNWLRNIGDEFF